jgi:hypothetical protein
MTAPERFADSQFLSCTAGAVHTCVFGTDKGSKPVPTW